MDKICNNNKYLKLFDSHNEYIAFTQTGKFVRPNVSHCIEENHVHYNPYYFPMRAWYNVTDDSVDTLLYNYYSNQWGHQYGSDMFTSAVIDGTEVSIDSLDANEGKYNLSAGEHIVEFFLIDNINLNGDVYSDGYWNGGIIMFDEDVTALTKLELPMGLKRIGGDSLRQIPNLTEVVIPSSVEDFGFTCFGWCQKLDTINVPEGVKIIESQSFCDCAFEEITLPNSLEIIETKSFLNCKNLESFHLPKNVREFFVIYSQYNYGTFNGCTALSSITVDSQNTTYDSRNNCNAVIETATNKLVAGCKNTIIPNDIETIGNNAFNGCSGLTSITIPSSVMSIEGNAFVYCSDLTSVTLMGTTPPTLGNYAFDVSASYPIYVPSSAVETYKAASGWLDYASRIQAIPNE